MTLLVSDRNLYRIVADLSGRSLTELASGVHIRVLPRGDENNRIWQVNLPRSDAKYLTKRLYKKTLEEYYS